MKRHCFKILAAFVIIFAQDLDAKISVNKASGEMVWSGREIVEDKFELKIGTQATIDVVYTAETIVTTNKVAGQQSPFQIVYHFDNGALFYIHLLKPDQSIDKKYEVKRIKKNGYGYRSVKDAQQLDFFFPRKHRESEAALIAKITPLELNNENQLLIYFEVLYSQIANYVANEVGTVAIFGSAVANEKMSFLYYSFDDAKFSATQRIKIGGSELNRSTKKYENRYRIDFNRRDLKTHKKIYFSPSPSAISDLKLRAQNSLNLDELRRQMLVAKTKTTIKNDIFLVEHFVNLIPKQDFATEEEQKFIGTYIDKPMPEVKFELRKDKTYHAKIENVELIGRWKMGEIHNLKAIVVYDVYELNKKVGSISKPVDVGSSFSILVKGEKLLYPIDPPAYVELKKL